MKQFTLGTVNNGGVLLAGTLFYLVRLFCQQRAGI
jgi:hypothetical protein